MGSTSKAAHLEDTETEERVSTDSKLKRETNGQTKREVLNAHFLAGAVFWRFHSLRV